MHVRGVDPANGARLELRAPREHFPHGIDRMNFTRGDHLYRLGCPLAPGASTTRLWLPPGELALWVVKGSQPHAGAPQAEATVAAVLGKVTEVTIEAPR